MSHYRGRRNRRGAYISPIYIFLVAGVIAAVAGIFMFGNPLSRRGGDTVRPNNTGEGNDIRAEEPVIPGSGGGEDNTPTEPQQPVSSTTASGISCTWKDLGEDAIYTGDLILVNNWTLFHFPADQESDLLCVLDNKTRSYLVKDATVYLLPAALYALNDMMDAFMEQGGSKTVNVVAGHRTAEFQQHLFDQSAERSGIDHARQYVAQPGGSEHHTGLVVDFSILHDDGSSQEYHGQGEYAWINENCQDYGYIVRYETGKEDLTGISDEPWHFRYIGVPHATEAAENGLCLEEYIDYLRQFTFEGEHLTIECVSGKYEVWYAQGARACVPDSGEYTVSGNNVDGVIVTCKIG